jgi:hypothetical protein
VDLFENEPARVWLLTDERRTPRRDVVALYNWTSKPLDVDIPLARAGLPEAEAYVAYDFWANAFVPPFKSVLRTSLAGESCRVLAVRPLLDRPFLLSTSRHITQGIVDVIEEQWNAARKTLNGKSQVVAGDPYELRVVAPSQPKSWKAVKAELSPDDLAAGAEIKLAQTDACVRATIRSPKSRAVSWKMTFE